MLSSSQSDKNLEIKRPWPIVFRDIILAAKADVALSRSSSQRTPLSAEPETVHEEQCAFQPPKRLNLLHLPPETLLQIAAKLCGTNAILALSQTNKQIHRIANEAMAKELVVRGSDLKVVLDWLARHPDMIARVNIVDVSAFQPTHNSHDGSTNRSSLSVADFSADISQVLNNMIWTNTASTSRLTLMTNFQLDLTSIWSVRHQACLDVLFALCPNIKTLKIGMPAAKLFDKNLPNVFPRPLISALPMANPTFEPVTPLQGMALQLARKNLRSLTVAQNNKWSGPRRHEILLSPSDIDWRWTGRHVITLQGFNKLERLDIPMDTLGFPKMLDFKISDELRHSKIRFRMAYGQYSRSVFHKEVEVTAKVLPLSLVSIKLRSCNERSFGFLQRFGEIPPESHLKHIDLYLDSCARSSILRCLENCSSYTPDFLVRITKLERMGIKVKFYTGCQEKLLDMQQELTMMVYLTPGEVALISLARRQFSDLNRLAMSRRRHSRLAQRIFTRHALGHFDLLNSPTFNAKHWIRSAFFHGAKNTKYDPNHNSKHAARPVTTRPRARPTLKPRINRLFNLDNYKFTFLAESTPFSEMPMQDMIKKMIWLLGKTDPLYNQVFPVRKHAIKSSANRQRKQKKAIRKSVIKLPDSTESLKKAREDAAKHLIVAQPSIYSTGANDEDARRAATIDGVTWVDVDWKVHLQPHLVVARAE
jgi:hypothetical protein